MVPVSKPVQSAMVTVWLIALTAIAMARLNLMVLKLIVPIAMVREKLIALIVMAQVRKNVLTVVGPVKYFITFGVILK
jgi:hypothetical protein